MLGVGRAIVFVGGIRRRGTDLYTFLCVVCVAASDAYHASSAGVVVVAPEAGGGDGEDRENASANELGVQSVVKGEGGGGGSAAAVAAEKQAAADLKLVADLVATCIQVRVLKRFHCETQIFQTLNPKQTIKRNVFITSTTDFYPEPSFRHSGTRARGSSCRRRRRRRCC